MERRLWPETAAYIGGDDADLMLAKAQCRHQDGLRPVRHLRSVPHGQHAFAGIEARHDPARLDRAADTLVQAESRLRAMRTLGERQIDISITQHMARDEVAGTVEPRPRAARDKTGNRIKNRWKWIGFEFDQLQGVLGNGAALCDDEGNR